MTTPTIRVAAIQMASAPHLNANLTEAEHLLESAAQQGARLVVLPEYFCLMGMHDTDKVALREHDGDGPIQRFLSDMARRYGMWLVGGSVPMVASVPHKVRNTCLVYDDTGAQVARYDKIHLFGFELGEERYRESNTIEPGNQVVTVDTPFGRLGLAICYDLRFPEMFRAMGKVDILAVPAAFTETTGKAHWEVLLRARAIENLTYLIASAQGGYHLNGRETHGDSMIIDPWGAVLQRLSRGHGVVVADISPAYRERVRQSLPALDHRTLVG